MWSSSATSREHSEPSPQCASDYDNWVFPGVGESVSICAPRLQISSGEARGGGQVRPARDRDSDCGRAHLGHPGLMGHHLRTEPVPWTGRRSLRNNRQRTNPASVRLNSAVEHPSRQIGGDVGRRHRRLIAAGFQFGYLHLRSGFVHRGAPADLHDLTCRSDDVLELQMSVIANSLQEA
jgi:hypothetical protein